VSLLSRERYVAVLGPDRVALLRRRPGHGARQGGLELTAQAPCAAPVAAAAGAALAGLLARPEIGRGDLTVLLSNHFVRYLLVPWSAEVGSPAELAAFAEICCDQVFGAASEPRIVLTSPEKAPGARLAAALDSAFVNALRGATRVSRLRLVSVQPYLMAAFNRLRPRLGQRDFFFLLAEPSRNCLLVSLGGVWSSVRASAAEDQPQALADLIEREAQLLGLAEGGMPPVFAHVARRPGIALPACHGVTPRTLDLAPLGEAAADPFHTMAMTVA